MASDTGFNVDMLDKLFARLERDNKAYYHDGWVCTVNTIKHQNINNGNTVKAIERELIEVPDEIIAHFVDKAGEKYADTLAEYGADVPSRKPRPVLKIEKVVKKKKELVVEAIVYPDWLNVEAWQEWEAYRKTKKKISDAARKLQWKLLEKYDQPTQAKIMEHSIQNDYQGLFPPKSGGAGNSKSFHVA
jgi:hypothetical protein